MDADHYHHPNDYRIESIAVTGGYLDSQHTVWEVHTALLTDEQVYKEVLVKIAETGVIDVNYYDVDDWFQHEKEWVAAVIACVYPLTQLP